MRGVLASFIFVFLFGCGSFKPIAPIKSKKVLQLSWAKNLDPQYVSGNLPIGTGAPRIFNDIVYMGSLSGEMKAYDLDTGRILWSFNDKTPLGAPVELFNDHIGYGGLSGRFFVRHYLTGELKYAIDLGAPVESAPVFHQGRLFIYLRGHQIVHLDAETGKIIWVYKRAVPVVTTLQRTSRPLILDKKVILGFADGHLGALSLDEGLLLWETKICDQAKFVDVDLNPVAVGGLILAGSPECELKALNPDNGNISRSFGVKAQASPMIKDNNIFVGSDEGEVLSMNISGDVINKRKISQLAVSALGWWKNHLVTASFDGKIRVLNPSTFEELDQFTLGYDYSAIYSDIVTTDTSMALYSSRNRLYLFQ
jgi:outer membrane protein assembly factor BamB